MIRMSEIEEQARSQGEKFSRMHSSAACPSVSSLKQYYGNRLRNFCKLSLHSARAMESIVSIIKLRLTIAQSKVCIA